MFLGRLDELAVEVVVSIGAGGHVEGRVDGGWNGVVPSNVDAVSLPQRV